MAFTKPARYNREDYASIVEDVWTGRNTDAAMQRVTPEMMEENRKHIKAGNPSKLPGDKWGIAKITLAHLFVGMARQVRPTSA